ncbi:MAG: amidohydrolase family protein [Planctomycetes bacterium]|nr:amidohydrolase family protein [Planctomycetota bacterium]
MSGDPDLVTTLWRDLLIVPMDGPRHAPLGEVRRADLAIAGDRITGIGALAPRPGDRVRDGCGKVALPGFVQGHVHFCQTLFRGLADDLPLLDWLRERIWPLEAAHDADSVRASAELSVAELLRGGTTSVQAIETVRFTEETFAVCGRVGLTAIAGNSLMDVFEPGVPDALPCDAREALRISEELCDAWHGEGRLAYAITPRFVLSCTDRLARDAAEFARARGLRVHTHACEHEAELAAVHARFGAGYLATLDAQGLLGPRSSLAHCVHVTGRERALLEASGASVLHCPSANQKLGSGIAPIASYQTAGVRIALGADGAPCNNRLSALTELRQAALLQALAAGPGAWKAEHALAALTCGAADALGLGDVGRLVPGKRADLVVLDLRDARLGVHRSERGEDVVSRVVWAADEAAIDTVLLGGKEVVRGGALLECDLGSIAARAQGALARVLTRAGLAR